MSRGSIGFAFLTMAGALAVASPTQAQSRRRFEPTDLRLQEPGVVEVDLQGGVVGGEDGSRVFGPDFEASVGVSAHVELELDGTFGLDANGKAAFLDHTLIAVRLGLVDVPDAPGSKSSWSAGLQAGARLPTMPHTHGLGTETLAIAGRNAGRLHIFGQVGTIVDPLEAVPNRSRDIRPLGIEGGVDLDLDLDDQGVWSLEAEVGAVKFLSPQLDQVHVAAGPSVQVMPGLELTFVALVGLLPGGDRIGALLGANTKFKTF